MLLPPLGGVEGRARGVTGGCDEDVGNVGERHSLAGCLNFLDLPRRPNVGDIGTGGRQIDFCKHSE